jgi:hypothetical protein
LQSAHLLTEAEIDDFVNDAITELEEGLNKALRLRVRNAHLFETLASTSAHSWLSFAVSLANKRIHELRRRR